LHADGQDFDPSAKQIDKMKMKTVALVSIMPFALHAVSLRVVIKAKKNENKEVRTNKKFFAFQNKNFALNCN